MKRGNRQQKKKVLRRDEQLNIYRVEGIQLLKKGRYDEGIDFLIKSGYKKERAHETAGFFLAANHKYEPAIKFLKISGTYIALFKLGDVYEKINDLESAVSIYELALAKANGQTPLVVEKLTKVYKKLKKDEKIKELAEKYNARINGFLT